MEDMKSTGLAGRTATVGSAANEQAPTLAEVVEVLQTLYPLRLAESWDHPGLIVGDPTDRVRRIVFAVDPTMATVDRALEAEADLIVCHHPLLFRSVHEVSGFGVHGAIVGKLYRAHCALWVGHTNADAACRGVGQAAADAFGLVAQRPLLVTGEQNGEPVGIGRVGSLSEPMTLGAFAQRVACAVPKTEYGIQVGGDLDALVSKVAVLPGSGDSEFDVVRAANADVYVTSDLRHHPATDALEQARYEAALQGAGVDPDAGSADSGDSVDVNDLSDITSGVSDDAVETIVGTHAAQDQGAEVAMRPALINTPHSAIESLWFDYAIEDVPNAVERATGYRLDAVRLMESTDPWRLVLGRD
jgi:dinuclear metal center YbgI/SA1388 family protein